MDSFMKKIILLQFLGFFLFHFTLVSSEQSRRVLEIPCEYDSDCTRNAFCNRTLGSTSNVDGLCECKNKYILQTNKTSMDCLPIPSKMGDSCEKTIQCQVAFGAHAGCLNNTCRCENNTHFEEGICYKNGKIGDRCDSSADCYIENTLTYCVRGYCECHTLYKPVENGTKCVKLSHLGSPCEEDFECTMNNSRCLGVCRCGINYVSSEDNRRCLKAADNFEDLCEEDAQCSQFLNNGACIKNQCKCISGYHEVKLRCWKTVPVFGDCDNDNECITNKNLTNAIACSDRKCTCLQGVVSQGKVGENAECIISESNQPNGAQSVSSQLLLFSNIIFSVCYLRNILFI